MNNGEDEPMSEFRVNIRTNNAAFWTDEDDTFDGTELARILRDIADAVDGYGISPKAQSIFDINGNRVGQYKHHESEGE